MTATKEQVAALQDKLFDEMEMFGSPTQETMDALKDAALERCRSTEEGQVFLEMVEKMDKTGGKLDG